MAGGETSAKKLAIAERRAFVAELRVSGMTYRDIAIAVKEHFTGLGYAMPKKYDAAAAYVDVKAVMLEYANQTLESAKELIMLELLRLDQLLAAHWQAAAITGEIPASEMVLKIMQRRDSLLGLSSLGADWFAKLSDVEASRRVVEGTYRFVEVVKDYRPLTVDDDDDDAED